jgi:hypothetical protein
MEVSLSIVCTKITKKLIYDLYFTFQIYKKMCLLGQALTDAYHINLSSNLHSRYGDYSEDVRLQDYLALQKDYKLNLASQTFSCLTGIQHYEQFCPQIQLLQTLLERFIQNIKNKSNPTELEAQKCFDLFRYCARQIQEWHQVKQVIDKQIPYFFCWHVFHLIAREGCFELLIVFLAPENYLTLPPLDRYNYAHADDEDKESSITIVEDVLGLLCEHNHVECLQRMFEDIITAEEMEDGLFCFYEPFSGVNAFMDALSHKRLDCLQILLTYFKLDTLSYNEQLCVNACMSGDVKILEFMLIQGCPITDSGQMIENCILQDSVDCLKLLLTNYLDECQEHLYDNFADNILQFLCFSIHLCFSRKAYKCLDFLFFFLYQKQLPCDEEIVTSNNIVHFLHFYHTNKNSNHDNYNATDFPNFPNICMHFLENFSSSNVHVNVHHVFRKILMFIWRRHIYCLSIFCSNVWFCRHAQSVFVDYLEEQTRLFEVITSNTFVCDNILQYCLGSYL